MILSGTSDGRNRRPLCPLNLPWTFRMAADQYGLAARPKSETSSPATRSCKRWGNPWDVMVLQTSVWAPVGAKVQRLSPLVMLLVSRRADAGAMDIGHSAGSENCTWVNIFDCKGFTLGDLSGRRMSQRQRCVPWLGTPSLFQWLQKSWTVCFTVQGSQVSL